MITRFAIYSPTLGMNQSYPHILLSKAITKNNTAVQIWNGEICKTKLRTIEFVRDTYSITNISGNAISISGNYVTQFPSGASITVYDSSNNYDTQYLSTTGTYTTGTTVITTVTSVSVSGNYVFNSDNVSSVDPADNDFLKVEFPDGNPALRYKTLRTAAGILRLVGFTKDHIYYWNTATTAWSLLFTCSSSCTYWDADQYGDYIVATNNIDRPVQWDGNTANTFENMDTQLSVTSDYIAAAGFVCAYQNYVIFGNVLLSSGTRYQDYFYWCNVGEGVSTGGFLQNVNGDAGAAPVDGMGDISGGFGKWQGYIVAFKRYSIQKIWYTGEDTPFAQSTLLEDIGCVAPGSVGNDWEGNLYYYGTDKAFREISRGEISKPINSTARDIKPSLVNLIRFTPVDEFSELRWAIPYGNAATANNKIVVYKEGIWQTDIDIAVTAFGSYVRQSSWTWLSLPFDSWNDWGWDSWISSEGSTDFDIDLCGDANGCTFQLHGGYKDDGETYTSSFELSTDLADKKALPVYKRVLTMYLYVQNEGSGTMAILAKRDNEVSFKSVGSINLYGDEDILRQKLECDVRGRHFLFKISSTSRFRFLGCEFEFIPVGFR